MNIIKIIFCLALLIPGYLSQSDTKISQEKSIVGKWTMCKRKHKNVITVSNICSTLVFNQDGTGYLEYPNNDTSNFKWAMDDNTVNFFFAAESDIKEFFGTDTVFTLKIYFEKFEHLDLINEASESAIYLGRTE